MLIRDVSCVMRLLNGLFGYYVFIMVLYLVVCLMMFILFVMFYCIVRFLCGIVVRILLSLCRIVVVYMGLMVVWLLLWKKEEIMVSGVGSDIWNCMFVGIVFLVWRCVNMVYDLIVVVV